MLESISAEILTKARERARAAGAGSIQLESRMGDVAEAVIDIAKEKAVNAIVVGKRGAGPVERLLLGSVSRKLVHLAPVPRLSSFPEPPGGTLALNDLPTPTGRRRGPRDGDRSIAEVLRHLLVQSDEQPCPSDRHLLYADP